MKWIPRQVWRSPVFLEVVEINHQPVVEAHLLDISPLGTLLEAPCFLVPEEMVSFRFRLPDEDATPRLDARVAWAKQNASGVGRHRMGLSFLKPNWWLLRACRKSSMVAAVNAGANSPETLLTSNLQALERVTALLGKIAADIGALRDEVAELRGLVRELRQPLENPNLIHPRH